MQRRQIKQTRPLQDRLLAFAKTAREVAALPPGAEKEQLLRKAGLADTTAQVTDWLALPGLRAPE